MKPNLFQSQRIAPGVTRIIGPGFVYAYLVEGREKALLIDTVCGVGDLKGYVEALTDLPLLVANTHCHGDHVSGNFQFDEVYIHPDDRGAMLREHPADQMDYVRGEEDARGVPHLWTEADVIEKRPIRAIDMPDGFVFDLGGSTIEVIAVPGHTRGTVVFLDRERRLMYAGDACNCNTLLIDYDDDLCVPATVETYRAAMQRLSDEYFDKFDRFFVAHGDWDIEKRIIPEMIETCDAILAGRDDAVPGAFLGMTAFIAGARDEHFRRCDGKIANILYTKNNIFNPH